MQDTSSCSLRHLNKQLEGVTLGLIRKLNWLGLADYLCDSFSGIFENVGGYHWVYWDVGEEIQSWHLFPLIFLRNFYRPPFSEEDRSFKRNGWPQIRSLKIKINWESLVGYFIWADPFSFIRVLSQIY